MSYPKTRAYDYNSETSTYELCYPISTSSAIYIDENETKTLGDKLVEIDGTTFSFLSTAWTLIASNDADYVTGLTLYKLTITYTLNKTVIRNYNCYNLSNEEMCVIVKPVDANSIKIISDEMFAGTIIL